MNNDQPPASQGRGRAICVLGMHRSGTSLTARLVHLLGAYLGEDENLFPAPPWNESGLWERRDIYLIHERILRSLGTTWDTPYPLPKGWQRSTAIEPFRAELSSLVEREFGHRSLWAWKDPRTVLLLPLWRDVLSESGIDLRCLCVTRNPLDVARSLSSRDGSSTDSALGVWLNYTLTLWEVTEGLPRALIAYDRLLGDWEDCLRPWMDTLRISVPSVGDVARTTIDKAIRVDLRHGASSLDDLRRAEVPAPIYEAAAALDSVQSPEDFDNAEVVAAMGRLLTSHVSSSSLYRIHVPDATDTENCKPEAAEQLSPTSEAPSELRAEGSSNTQSGNAELVELRERHRDHALKIVSLEGEIAAAQTKRQDLEQLFHIRGEQLVAFRNASKTAAELVKDLVDSRSWRITRPLRTAQQALQSLHRGPKGIQEAILQARVREARHDRWTTRRRPTVSVCVLTQNHGATIVPCLDSVADIADEIVVVDSGSTDGTLDLVRRYAKARVIQHRFEDIASQRNIYLSEATQDWVLSIDADEIMGVGLADKLPGLLQGANCNAYWFPRYWITSTNPFQYVQNEVTYPDHQLRLVANLPGLTFYNRVHQEIVVPGAELAVETPHLFHLHYLLNSRRSREERLRRYEQLQALSGSGVYRKYYLYEDYPFEIHPCREDLNVDLATKDMVRGLMNR